MNTINTRLSTEAPDLVELGNSLSESRRKAIAHATAEWACRKSDAVSVLGEEQLQRLLQTSYSATQEDKQMLSDEMETLDGRYFDIVEEHDGLDEQGDALQWFAKARAIASLHYSLDSEDLLNFCEALYEAQAATGDLTGLRELCNQ